MYSKANAKKAKGAAAKVQRKFCMLLCGPLVCIDGEGEPVFIAARTER